MLFPLLVILLSSFPLIPQAQLEISASCNGAANLAVKFQRPEDIFGTACCRDTPYNSYTDLCCNGTVRNRRRDGQIAELCCGTEVLRYDQTCCDGVVHNVVNGDCCGKAVFIRSDRTFLCCNGSLVRTAGQNDICCGAEVFDGGRNQICCGDRVFDKNIQDSCCRRNDGTFVPFKSANQICCNDVIQRGTNMSCCYLRNSTGAIIPTSFNFNTQCCRFPFATLSNPVNGSCAF